MDKFLIIDASGLLYRSFFALPPLTSPSGEPTGALFGFIRSLLRVQQKLEPSHIVAVFDGPDNKRSRLEIFPAYKATRKPTPDELITQIQTAQDFCQLYGIPTLNYEGVEADDTIASCVQWAKTQTKGNIYICSADKDLAQLVDDQVHIVNPAKDEKIVDKQAVVDHWGVPPEKLIDLFALIGDTSDNIPGIEGIGPKTALSLLQEWHSLDSLLENAAAISGKKGERIRAGKESALLSRTLIALNTAIPIPQTTSFYSVHQEDAEKLIAFFLEKGFKSLVPLVQHPTTTSQTTFEIIQSEAEFNTCISTLSKQNTVAIDCETTDLDEFKA